MAKRYAELVCNGLEARIKSLAITLLNPETTPGGRALKFFSSVRVQSRSKQIKNKDQVVGIQMILKIIKNKVSPPFKEVTFDYYFNGGIDVVKDIMNTAIDMEIIKRAGAWYYMGDDSKNPSVDAQGNQLKWQGKENAEAVIKNSPDLYNYIYDIVVGNINTEEEEVEEEIEEAPPEEEKEEGLV